MSVLNCLIVDDEELARRLVRAYCDRLPGLRVIGEAPNPVAALPLLRETTVDLLFLDIQMPEMIGLDFLRTLRRRPAVVLTTAYSEYALEGFDLDVADYLLKPFGFERFVRAVGKARDHRFAASYGTGAPPPPNAMTESPTYQVVRADRKVYRIPHAEILYVESLREYVAYHTSRGRTVALGSLRQLEEELPANFLRVHKSFIVAADKVEVLEGNQLLVGQARIPIGGSYREAVKLRLFP
ncbi:LytR/AlgR family response regulator transcription factor [Neolewinella litorea]|uniref:Response regulator transcription factor n=1 Tax=Neolewinella litorea TaxID=2562452 RepID=A0A4V3XL40_9BACT|nr:LytTR family DNA-binding domain-containing protein [Neolewinella litorea]THH39343.1 response regulator transcription factor [Neolewinella litorea]